jgi:hypothetical protein
MDGYHAFGAVVEDFASWLPKMSSKGTVIFEDINVYRPKFGLWHLWEELKRKYPAYSFHYNNGLGILYVGDKTHNIDQVIEVLNSKREYAALAQRFFAHLAENASQGTQNNPGKIERFHSDKFDENILKFDALLRSHRITRTVARGLWRSLLSARAQYWLAYLSREKRQRYATRKREIKDAIAYLNWKMGVRRPEYLRGQALRRDAAGFEELADLQHLGL